MGGSTRWRSHVRRFFSVSFVCLFVCLFFFAFRPNQNPREKKRNRWWAGGGGAEREGRGVGRARRVQRWHLGKLTNEKKTRTHTHTQTHTHTHTHTNRPSSERTKKNQKETRRKETEGHTKRKRRVGGACVALEAGARREINYNTLHGHRCGLYV